MPIEFCGFVLAGGASTRMNTDKAFVSIAGRPLVSIVAAALSPARTVTVIGGDEGRIRGLGLDYLPDDEPGAGPLAALVVALRSSPAEVTVLAACDLPNLSPTAIEHLVGALGDAECSVPIVGGHRQWDVTCWRTDKALDVVQRLRATGARSMRAPATTLRTSVLLDTADEWYLDVDTPADLQRIEGRG